MRPFVVLTVALLAGCAINPVSKRPEFVLVSTEKEKEIGKNAAAEVAQSMGLYDKADLVAYVREIGQRLAAHSPRQDVTYTFDIADEAEPNAFALPGGYVFVTRGLLVLVNSEDELACVVGHEIGHVAARHSVQQISRSAPFGVLTGITSGVAGIASPLLGSLVGGVGELASGLVLAPYSREQEREADRIGQQLAAEAGWDPTGMTSFLRTLARDEQLRGAANARRSFLASHPATPERVENTAQDAATFRPSAVEPISPTRSAFLRRFAGLPTGVDVATGYFVGRTFVHPDFDFQIAFPSGWSQRNTPSAAAAGAPDGAALLAIALAARSDDPMEGARQLAARGGEGLLAETQRTTVAGLPAAHAVFRARGQRGDLGVDVTWIALRGNVFELVGVTNITQLTAFQRPFEETRQSFRPLTADERAGVRENRLRLVDARPGETPADIAARTASTWSADLLAVLNELTPGQTVPAGETVKTSVAEKYF